MGKLLNGLMLVVFVFAASSARAAEVADLDPSTPWNMNYAPNSCLLMRTFGVGKDQVTLRIDQFNPQALPEFSLVGKRFARFLMTGTRVTATFGPGLPSGEVSEALVGTTGPEALPLLVLGTRDILNRSSIGHTKAGGTDLSPPTPEQTAAVTQLFVEAGSVQVLLHTGSLASPLKAMRSCLDALVRDWGLDPAQQAKLSRRAEPIGSPGNWFNSNDYPARALAKNESSLIRFRLMVDATGKPTSCYVQQATMTREFIDLTCALLVQRARFTPALDADGAPTASYYINAINWLVPG